MNIDRRDFVVGVSTTVAAALGVAGGGTVLASEHSTVLVFREVNPGQEYVIIGNTGESEIDLSGYWMEFELGQQVSQARQFPEGTTIEAGGTLKVASGAVSVEDAVSLGYTGEVMRNDGSDTMAVLAPDEETVVIRSDEDLVPSEDGDGGTDGGGTDGDDTGNGGTDGGDTDDGGTDDGGTDGGETDNGETDDGGTDGGDTDGDGTGDDTDGEAC